MNGFEILRLSPGRGSDFFKFFDSEAFGNNPDWAGCYCQFYLTDHRKEDWERKTAAENRTGAEDKIHSGLMHGYLAFLDRRVVGWCHAGPRSGFAALEGDPELVCEDAAEVGSIVCFIVSPGERGKGIATKLLDAACEGLQEMGLRWAEGYPRVGTVSQAANYHGPRKMYEQAGFSVYRSYPNYVIMRKQLHD